MGFNEFYEEKSNTVQDAKHKARQGKAKNKIPPSWRAIGKPEMSHLWGLGFWGSLSGRLLGRKAEVSSMTGEGGYGWNRFEKEKTMQAHCCCLVQPNDEKERGISREQRTMRPCVLGDSRCLGLWALWFTHAHTRQRPAAFMRGVSSSGLLSTTAVRMNTTSRVRVRQIEMLVEKQRGVRQWRTARKVPAARIRPSSLPF